MTEPIIYVASAGTGKSTALLNDLAEQLETHTPETIVFTTFTNAGAQETAKRAMERFPQFKEYQFRYFRTLHSIAYRSIPHKKVITFRDYIALGKQLGLSINAKRALSGTDNNNYNEFSLGDKLLHLDALKRNRRLTWSQVAQIQELSNFSPSEIQDFSEKYQKFRLQNHVYDFTDQLEQFLTSLDSFPNISNLYVDEAQDLCKLQWEIINQLSKQPKTRTVVAGDDKQAIYGFNGGDPRTLITLPGRRKILSTTYRCPSNILEYAETIAQRIKEKQEYTCQSNKMGGSVQRVRHLKQLKDEMKQGTWFILVRNRKFLEHIERTLNEMGVLFESDLGSALDPKLCEAIPAWEELIRGYGVESRIIKHIYHNYLRGADTVAYGFKKTIFNIDDDETVTWEQLNEGFGLLTKLPWNRAFTLPQFLMELAQKAERDGELGKPPRIRATTIHAVKGREAENVVLLPDQTRLTRMGFQKNPDDEHRVFYVGATRTRNNLFLHQPLTDQFYPL